VKNIVLISALLGLAGCATTNDAAKYGSYPSGNLNAHFKEIDLQKLSSKELESMTAEQRVTYEGIHALRNNDLAQASRLFNLALKMDVTRSELHLLNALTYHLMAKSGDGGKYELAEEGYRLAIKFDENNWLAHYYFGLCSLDQRKFASAQRALANAVSLQTRDTGLLYDLAVASYYAHDPLTANGALERIKALDPAYAGQEKVLRTTALVRATLNDQTGANEALEKLKAVNDGANLNAVRGRLDDWANFYKTSAGSGGDILLAQSGFTGGSGFGGGSSMPSPNAYPTAPSFSGGGSPSPFVEDKMVVVDVVIIGTQDDSRTTYGINLLNGLKLQFGDSSSATAAFTKGREVTTTNTDGTTSQTTSNTLSSLVRIPSVNYSLNIANAINGQDEVLAKPSLVALSGQTSEFFSGVEISAAAVSGGAGDSISIQKEIGVKLSVRPDFLADNKIRLQVSAQRTFLTDPSNSVVFTYRLDTTKTNVNANVVLKFGETLILSGLTERDVTKSVNGVPFLRNIPGLNMVFSEHGTRDYQKSILILLTPRKPVYTAQSAEDRQAVIAGMSEYEKSVERLQQRNKDWFRPQSTFEDVRKLIDAQEFFREFRTGDVPVDQWEKRDSNTGVLSQLLNSLI
jgi:tetratricopeptide (TPR) repeat protein